jgi:hypothetical protein
VRCAQLLLALLPFTSLAEEPKCTCAEAQRKNGWCEKCKVGYVALIELRSFALFETLDAHGHDVDPDKISCPSCRKALETDGYCETCRMGFVRKQAYLSRLAYYLGRGEVLSRDRITCPDCRKHSEGHGWCERCKRGMVGQLALKSRDDVEPAARAFARLRAAIDLLKRCEQCAIALFCDGRCRLCKVSYLDGKAVPRTPSRT